MSYRLTVRLSDSLCQKVGALAARRGVTASDIIRDALRAYFDTPPPAAPRRHRPLLLQPLLPDRPILQDARASCAGRYAGQRRRQRRFLRGAS
jgi:hypothetical protein